MQMCYELSLNKSPFPMSSPARADAASLSMLVAAITDEHDDGSKRGGADVHKTIADNNSSLRSATDIRSMKGGGAAVTNSSARGGAGADIGSERVSIEEELSRDGLERRFQEAKSLVKDRARSLKALRYE